METPSWYRGHQSPHVNERLDDTAVTSIEIGDDENAMNSRERLWLVVLAAALLITYASPLKEHLTHLNQIKQDLSGFGSLAPMVFVLAMTGLTAIGIPRMVMYPIAGLAFGFSGGLAWSMIATVGGAYITFLYARWAGRSLVMKKWPAMARITTKLDGSGILAIALLRQMPTPGFLTNLLFGISAVRTSSYILGTVLGSIPSAIPATLIGSSLSHADHDLRVIYIMSSIVMLLVMWLGFGLYLRKRAKVK